MSTADVGVVKPSERGRFAGKRVLVTGGAGGMGRSAALRFAEEGADVAIVDIAREAGERTLTELRSTGRQACFFAADASSSPDIQAAIERASGALGGIDVLFCHAGTIIVRPLHETSDEEYDRLMAINARSAFLSCRAVLPGMMQQRRGAIVITSSIGGERGFPLEGVYCMSKGAVLQLARTIAAEYRTYGIRCNAVCPGFVQTAHGLREIKELDQLGQRWEDADLAATQQRMCEPEEVAAAALFLASDDASFINGAALYVDNGWHSKG
jgi:NAD(P)-dependent dehydrogenase (short-subunit alcohol dehydrogenase family)